MWILKLIWSMYTSEENIIGYFNDRIIGHLKHQTYSQNIQIRDSNIFMGYN